VLEQSKTEVINQPATKNDKMNTVNRTALSGVLNDAASIVSPRTTLPILGNVLIRLVNSSLTVEATDLDLYVSATIEAEIEGFWEITVPAKRLAAIVRELPSETVGIEIAGEKIVIKSGGAKASLFGLSAEEFPQFDRKEGAEIQIHGSALLSALRRVAYATSTDETRHILNGVRLDEQDGKLIAIATDGRRLAVAQVCESATGMPGVILPNKAVSALLKMIDGTDVVSVRFGESAVEFDAGRVMLSTKLIEGSFPNWRQVMPNGNGSQIKIDREALLSASRRVSLLVNEKSNALGFTVTNGQVELSAQSPDVGESRESVECSGDVEEKTAVNPLFLNQCLAALPGEKVEMAFRGEGQPVTILGAGFQYVLMPMRVG
jgi:DNA polymerase-3 subunit beta